MGLSGVEWGGAAWGCHVYSINYPCSNTLCNELRTIPLTGPEERKKTSFNWMCTYARSQLKSPSIAQRQGSTAHGLYSSTRWATPKVKKGMFLALHARDTPLMQGRRLSCERITCIKTKIELTQGDTPLMQGQRLSCERITCIKTKIDSSALIELTQGSGV